MALSLNDTAATAVLRALRLHIDHFAGETALRIYSGTAPANAQANLSGQTLLASFTIPNPSGVEPTGRDYVLSNPPTVKALAAGTATFFRIGKLSDGGGTAMLQGLVTDGAGAGEMKLNKTAIVKDEDVDIVEVRISL